MLIYLLQLILQIVQVFDETVNPIAEESTAALWISRYGFNSRNRQTYF